MGGEYRDVELQCSDCGAPFVFNAGQQAFYARKGLHTPKRCKACNQKRKTAGTYGSQVVMVDSRSDEVLCKRCSRPASRMTSWKRNEALCAACATGRDPRDEVTPDHDRFTYEEWGAHYNITGGQDA